MKNNNILENEFLMKIAEVQNKDKEQNLFKIEMEPERYKGYNLSLNEMVLLSIYRRFTVYGGEHCCKMTLESISENTGLQIRTLIRAKKKLESQGWISVVKNNVFKNGKIRSLNTIVYVGFDMEFGEPVVKKEPVVNKEVVKPVVKPVVKKEVVKKEIINKMDIVEEPKVEEVSKNDSDIYYENPTNKFEILVNSLDNFNRSVEKINWFREEYKERILKINDTSDSTFFNLKDIFVSEIKSKIEGKFGYQE